MFSYILSFTPAGKYESHHMELHGPQPHTTAQNWKTYPKYQLKNSPYARQHNLMKNRILTPPGKKKKNVVVYSFSNLFTTQSPEFQLFLFSCVAALCTETLFPPFLPFRRNLPIPLRLHPLPPFFLRFLFIVLSAHRFLSVILPKAEGKVSGV